MTPPIWLGSAFVLAALASLLFSSWTIVALLLPAAEPRIRAVGTILTGVWFHAVLFYLLAFTGIFTLIPALLTFLIFALGSGLALWKRPGLRACLALDAHALHEHVSLMFSPTTRVATLGFGAAAALQFAHSTLAPPLSWDGLTYHLPRAALWTQNGSLEETFGAPMAWEYFGTFWPIGDTISAWIFVLTMSDLWIPLAWGIVWLAGVLCSYVLARELRARPDHAWVAALAAWSIPAMARHAFVGHIENLLLMLVVGGLAMLVASARTRDPLAAMVGLAGLGTCAVIKPSALPYAAAAAVAFGWIALTRYRHRKLLIALAPIPGLVASLPTLIRQAVVHGSPMYPYGLKLGGKTIFEGSEEFAFVLAHETKKTPFDYFERLFLDGPYGGYVTHVNFGPITPVIVVLGLAGLVYFLRKGPSRVAVAAFLGFSFFALWEFLHSYTWTGNNVGRHVATIPLLLAVLASTIPRAWIRDVLAVVMFGNLVFFLPFNWHAPDRTMLWDVKYWLILIALVLAVSAWVVWRARSRRVALAISVAWCVGFAAFSPPLEELRTEKRYVLYRSAGLSRSYTNIRLGGRSGIPFRSWNLWKRLDKPDRPLKLAVSAGWDTRGINWANYPLFGRRLQNRITYVPPTKSGRVVSPRKRVEYRSAGDYESWKARLKQEEIDYVVLYYPITTHEAKWVQQYEDDFEIVMRTGWKKTTILAKPKF